MSPRILVVAIDIEQWQRVRPGCPNMAECNDAFSNVSSAWQSVWERLPVLWIRAEINAYL